MTLHHGDCIEVMAGMEPGAVDAIVTDPPYGLEFMGKRWDAFKSPGRGARVRTERAAEMTAPGKGHSTSKGPFLAAGVDQYVAGSPFQAWCEAWGREALRVTKPGGYLLAFGGTRTHHRLVCGLEDAGWIIRDELDWIYASGFPKGRANLKPAHEPIVLARKPGPLRPLAIDECRISYAGPSDYAATVAEQSGPRSWKRQKTATTSIDLPPTGEVSANPSGRWPSNVLLSDPELFDEPNSYVVGSGATVNTQVTRTDPAAKAGTMFGGAMSNSRSPEYLGDVGGYSRFFIIPKADRADREPVLLPDGHDRAQRFTTHPTVKPVDLMRHLVRLVTPIGGTLLDPFLGSGTTAIAAEMEGFAWIGIEREAEYIAIAEARLNGTQRGLGLPA